MTALTMALTMAQQRLVERHLRIAQLEAARVATPATWDDCLASAYLGLVMTAPLPARQFGALARIACRHQIMTDRRDHHRPNIGARQRVEIDLAECPDSATSPLDALVASEDAERLTTALGVLTRRQREVVERRMAGQLMATIATEMQFGCRQQCSETLSRSVRKLRAVMGAP